MGQEYNLGQMYSLNNMQYSMPAYSSMLVTANAAASGNYSYLNPQTNFMTMSMPPFGLSVPTFGNYTGLTYTGNLLSSQSSSKDSYEEKLVKEAEERKKRIKETKEKTLYNLEQAKKSVLFKGLTKDEEKVLLEEHSKTFEPDAKLLGGIATGVAMGSIMKNGGLISHGWNTVKSLGKDCPTNMMFKGNESLWKKSSNLMQEAYYQMHKAERRHHTTAGLLKKSYSDKTYQAMEDMMFKAIQGGNTDEIAKVTETFKQINVNDGWFNRTMKRLRGQTLETADDILDKATKGTLSPEITSTINKGAKVLVDNASMTWGKALKQASGGKMGLIMGLLGLIPEIGNIKKAFSVDKKTGLKQAGQSAVKFLANWGGYIAGETVGIMAGAKLGALVGSVVPGLGTAIGAVAGIVCGTVVSCLAANGAKKLMGFNVANSVKTQEIAKQEGGADQILQTLLAQAQSGELTDPEALKILEKYQTTQPQQELAVA